MNDPILIELVARYPQLEGVENEIRKAGEALISCYEQGGKVLICGNGGSASDSDHIVGELMKGFEHKRPLKESLQSRFRDLGGAHGMQVAQQLQAGLPAIALTVHNALITAVANDMDAHLIFAQQVMGLGKTGDILVALSTSGNSRNILDAILTAKVLGMQVIGLTGSTGGRMKDFCDILINVTGTRTSFIQELHLPVYHALCMMVENHFFGNNFYDKP